MPPDAGWTTAGCSNTAMTWHASVCSRAKPRRKRPCGRLEASIDAAETKNPKLQAAIEEAKGQKEPTRRLD